MYISYSADTYDTLSYGIISFRPWERECALAVAEQIKTVFCLPNNIDEDDGEVYFEIDDRHLFYGEIKPYFFKAVSAFYDKKREEKRLAELAAKAVAENTKKDETPVD